MHKLPLLTVKMKNGKFLQQLCLGNYSEELLPKVHNIVTGLAKSTM